MGSGSERAPSSPPRRTFTARIEGDMRSVSDRPFVLAYERPGGVDPDAAAQYDVMGDASPSEMIRLCTAICLALHEQGIWFPVLDEMDRVLEAREARANAVQRPVQRPSALAGESDATDTAAVA